jgi:hypothetical protein
VRIDEGDESDPRARILGMNAWELKAQFRKGADEKQEAWEKEAPRIKGGVAKEEQNRLQKRRRFWRQFRVVKRKSRSNSPE